MTILTGALSDYAIYLSRGLLKSSQILSLTALFCVVELVISEATDTRWSAPDAVIEKERGVLLCRTPKIEKLQYWTKFILSKQE